LRSFQKHPKATIRYQSDFLVRRLHAVTHLFRKPVSDDQSTFEDRIAEKYELAYRHYRMTAYDGVVDLFRVGTRLYYLDDPIYMGWKPYAGKGVRIHEVKGDHKDIFLPPHDKDFAANLQQVLNDSNRDFRAGE
jgi:thioesterase domain-containing protein